MVEMMLCNFFIQFFSGNLVCIFANVLQHLSTMINFISEIDHSIHDLVYLIDSPHVRRRDVVSSRTKVAVPVIINTEVSK